MKAVGPRCGVATTFGNGRGSTGKFCDRPTGHPGEHASGRVAHGKIGSDIGNGIRKKNSDHPYAWTRRENNWRRYRVECLPGCTANDGWLCRQHYLTVWEFQGGRCPICDGFLPRGVKPYPAADHLHRDPDGRGPFRGILHGGPTGCNVRFVGGYEKGRRFPDERLNADCEAYLSDPPAVRLVREGWGASSSPSSVAKALYSGMYWGYKDAMV